MRKMMIALIAASSAFATAAPAFEGDTDTEQTFSNRGQCQRALKQARNEERRTARTEQGTNSGEFNRTSKGTSRCEAFTDENGERMFRLVSQDGGGSV